MDVHDVLDDHSSLLETLLSCIRLYFYSTILILNA